jgi:hypothetical protein
MLSSRGPASNTATMVVQMEEHAAGQYHLTREERREVRKLAWKTALRPHKRREGRPGTFSIRTQRLHNCPSLVNPPIVIVSFFVLGFLMLPTGVLLYQSFSAVKTVELRYDDSCPNPVRRSTDGCVATLRFELSDAVEPPVDIYYRLTNFFQNYRTFTSSRNQAQLRGDTRDSSYLSQCEPYMMNSNGQIFTPCGLYPLSSFNDSFQLADPNGRLIDLSPSGVAWPSDVERVAGNPAFESPDTRILTNGQMVPDFEAERFVAWMRSAAFPTFLNKYAVVSQELPAGNYTLTVLNQFPTAAFDGRKEFVLQSRSWIGGGHVAALAYVYIISGSLLIILATVFSVLYCTSESSSMTPAYIEWAAENPPVIVPGRLREFRVERDRLEAKRVAESS